MENKPMAGWRVVLLFWGVGGLTYPATRAAMGDTASGLVFLALLIATSTYLYSRRFAALVNSILGRLNLI
jgi:hypothetical protein